MRAIKRAKKKRSQKPQNENKNRTRNFRPYKEPVFKDAFKYLRQEKFRNLVVWILLLLIIWTGVAVFLDINLAWFVIALFVGGFFINQVVKARKR